VEVFPSNLVAGPLGFRAQEYFEVEAAVERQGVGVSFGG
jgi:hypothetical protein